MEVVNPTMAEVCVKALPFALFISFFVFSAMIFGYIIGASFDTAGRILVTTIFTTAGMIGGILVSLRIITKIYEV